MYSNLSNNAAQHWFRGTGPWGCTSCYVCTIFGWPSFLGTHSYVPWHVEPTIKAHKRVQYSGISPYIGGDSLIEEGIMAAEDAAIMCILEHGAHQLFKARVRSRRSDMARSENDLCSFQLFAIMLTGSQGNSYFREFFIQSTMLRAVESPWRATQSQQTGKCSGHEKCGCVMGRCHLLTGQSQVLVRSGGCVAMARTSQLHGMLEHSCAIRCT